MGLEKGWMGCAGVVAARVGEQVVGGGDGREGRGGGCSGRSVGDGHGASTDASPYKSPYNHYIGVCGCGQVVYREYT